MNDNILVLGIKTQAFLKATAMGLKKCGFQVKLEKSDIVQCFQLIVNNYLDIQQSFKCQCFEMSPSPSELEIESISTAIKQAKCIIIAIPVKLFPSWRYNADDNLSNISNWIAPAQLQNIIHSAIGNEGVLLSWAITGTDNVPDLFLSTAHLDNAAAVVNAESVDDFLLKSNEAIKNFFVEGEETEFLARCNKHETVSFVFLPEQTSRSIGEKASALWNVRIFFETVIGHLPGDLFTML